MLRSILYFIAVLFATNIIGSILIYLIYEIISNLVITIFNLIS